MFALINGKPIFYAGKINSMGYTSEKEREMIVKQLKEDNPDVEIKDEVVKIDEKLREKAIKLGELQLTHSKSEFMKYLTGEKPLLYLELQELQQAVDILLGEIDDE